VNRTGSREPEARNGPSGSGILLATFVASSALVFSEWLFFATKPSFLLTVAFAQRVGALVSASALLGLLFAAALMPVVALFRVPLAAKFALLLARVPAAVLFAITALLLLDGFTVTLFRRGIRDARALPGRVLYGVLLLAFLALGYRLACRLDRLFKERGRRRILAAVLVAAVAVLAAKALAGAGRREPSGPGAASAAVRDHDIVLVGADGLEAWRTSLYGNARDNTPFLRQMAESALVAETAYSNSGQTTGSITSLLTGKLPTTTRVHYPPDALRSIDQYEHLPGLLRRMGYRTFFAGVRNYADPLELRLLDAFDEVGEVQIARPSLTRRVDVVTGATAAHLLNLSTARISERLAHVVLGVPMPDPKRQVSSGLAARESDDDRFKALVRFLERPGGPKFAHAHFLGTHGPDFSPTRSVFSKLGKKAPHWDPDAQDDAILDFDDRVRELFGLLDRLGRRDRTIVVVYSDHGQLYRLDVPVPLLFIFPPGGPRGRIRGATQLVDVAPTLLQELGVPRPAWMQGTSLLGKDVGPCRSVLSARSGGVVEQTTAGGLRIIYERPWYSLGHLALIACSGTWWLYPEAGFTPREFTAFDGASCDPTCSPVRSEATAFFRRALERGGYPFDAKVPPLSYFEAVALASAVKGGAVSGPPGRAVGAGNEPVTRAEAAMLAGRARHCALVVTTPPAASFSDVRPSDPLRPWIDLLETEVGGVGCGEGRFCPDGTLKPAEMRRWLGLAPLPDPNG